VQRTAPAGRRRRCSREGRMFHVEHCTIFVQSPRELSTAIHIVHNRPGSADQKRPISTENDPKRPISTGNDPKRPETTENDQNRPIPAVRGRGWNRGLPRRSRQAKAGERRDHRRRRRPKARRGRLSLLTSARLARRPFGSVVAVVGTAACHAVTDRRRREHAEITEGGPDRKQAGAVCPFRLRPSLLAGPGLGRQPSAVPEA
jgi:hypothetical protein